MALLEVKNLTKEFGGLKAVNDVSFKVEEKSIVGLIGPNGAGKTTIFNLITGVYATTLGEIRFNGEIIQKKPTHEIIQMGITRTFQNIRLFKKLTVYENIVTACHNNVNYSFWEAMLLGTLPKFLSKKTRMKKQELMIKERAEQLMEVLNLTDRRDSIASNLPYGIQRRLEIARALAANPKLLLLDEPAAGMNPEETERLMELIVEIKEKFNVSILLIEHHMDLIMGICDKIVVLNFGCKLSEGDPAEIQNNSKVREAYLGGVADVEG
ncbi:MAG: ABC transporter ATP-binding protein [Clostridium sp.]|uniref:ABC transporter ATP-binding protein n=1 Tax=Clostridium sp. TaxID=1506 RepID=UPI00303246AE